MMNSLISVYLKDKYISGFSNYNSVIDILSEVGGFDEDLCCSISCNVVKDEEIFNLKKTTLKSMKELISSYGMTPFVTGFDEPIDSCSCYNLTFIPKDKTYTNMVDGVLLYDVEEINKSDITSDFVEIPEKYTDVLNSSPCNGIYCNSNHLINLYYDVLKNNEDKNFYVREKGKYYQLFLN